MTSERRGISRRTLFKGVGFAAAAGALNACTNDAPSIVGGGLFRGRVHEYWLQLENRPWDAAPANFDRMTGQALSSGAGPYMPASGDVLILRNYAADWAAPLDAPVNSWDLTEPDPAIAGGGFPGAVLRARVGDRMIVHFRNRDERAGKSDEERTHSLHAHGVQREAVYDGAFPLSPPDPAQGAARGDRVPPGGVFTYQWSCPHQAAAGAWLYHDASLSGWRTSEGGFGVLVISAPGEPEGDPPTGPVRAPGDTAISFSAVPPPPRRGDYLLVFHELDRVGLCINGRRGLGSTPALVAGPGTRMTVRAVNATDAPLSFYLAGHRWQEGLRWMDAELIAPGAGVSLSILSDSFAEGGGLGEWLITGRAGGQSVQGSLVVTEGGAVRLATG